MSENEAGIRNAFIAEIAKYDPATPEGARCIALMQRRRDSTLAQLSALPAVPESET